MYNHVFWACTAQEFPGFVCIAFISLDAVTLRSLSHCLYPTQITCHILTCALMMTNLASLSGPPQC